ncbi:MAG: Tll0287-like domain-containing protein [Weeksellaceae bacterium]
MKTLMLLSAFTFVLFGCNKNEKPSTNQIEDSSIVEEFNDSISSDKDKYLERGKAIAGQAQGVLGKNLIQALNAEGPVFALEFCSAEAIPLTDSAALSSDVKLKRVSDKNRNPNNVANDKELKIINLFKSQINQGVEVKPEVEATEDHYVGYYPIVTNTMCLQCHGTPKVDINEETYAKIKSLYPADKAFGYDINELRGMWVVEMKID